MKSNAFFPALAVALAVAVAVPASAAVVVDQASLPGDGMYFTSNQTAQFAAGAITGPYGFAQSFTVGLDGALDSIALGLVNTGAAAIPIDVRIYAGVPANLSATPLYSGVFEAPVFRIPLGAFTSWSSLPTIDLSAANLQVSAGQVLTLALTTQVSLPRLGWLEYGDDGEPFTYAAGARYGIRNGALGLMQPFGNDFSFRTFVNQSAAPEPGAWALMIGGFGLAGAALRRRAAARGRAVA